jgi:hypothetical protein
MASAVQTDGPGPPFAVASLVEGVKTEHAEVEGPGQNFSGPVPTLSHLCSCGDAKRPSGLSLTLTTDCSDPWCLRCLHLGLGAHPAWEALLGTMLCPCGSALGICVARDCFCGCAWSPGSGLPYSSCLGLALALQLSLLCR